ncbi:MAG: hypothetical protein L0221_15930, partial [Chloroflexi bacterium]|nr:hypothetical protein [Chloroflexota bacterium]
RDDELVAAAAAGARIAGTLFEDVDGDANIVEAGTQRFANATVRLYQDNATVGTPEGTDGLVATVTTDALGNYAFIGLANGNYWVAVDSKTLAPGAGYNAGFTIANVWAEQTYGDDSTTAALDLGARYGGRSGAAATADNAGAANTAEHLSRVNIAGGVDATGVNSGFSFSAITNNDGDNNDDDASKAGVQQQGSLRQFIMNSNAIAGVQTSNFSINYPVGGQTTIAVSGAAFSSITDAVILDATTQEGAGTAPRIVVNGAAAGAGADGFQIWGAGSSGSTIRGFVINGFQDDGIIVFTSSNNLIAGNWIGTNATGTGAVANAANGIELLADAVGNTVGGTSLADRNVISGNAANGIWITNAGNTGNVVLGNYIGVDASGTADLGNGNAGIEIGTGAANNIIGGTDPNARNIISGNAWDGVRIAGTGANNNRVEGNYIGTDVTGTLDLGNDLDGVFVFGDADNNTIGGAVAAAGNVISGNNSHGVEIDGATSGVIVQANRIGTTADGSGPLGNSRSGVSVGGGATNNVIGFGYSAGAETGLGNTIAFNGGPVGSGFEDFDGVQVTGATA